MKSSYVSARHVTIDDWTAASPQASLESSSECIAKLGVLVWTALVKHRSSQIHGCASRQQGSTLTTAAGPNFPRGPKDGWGPSAPPPQTRLLHGRGRSGMPGAGGYTSPVMLSFKLPTKFPAFWTPPISKPWARWLPLHLILLALGVGGCQEAKVNCAGGRMLALSLCQFGRMLRHQMSLWLYFASGPMQSRQGGPGQPRRWSVLTAANATHVRVSQRIR